MDKNNIQFSNNIGHLLKINDLTQEDFANKIGRKKSVIGAYLKGGTLPRVDVLIDISNYFGITIDSLLSVDLTKSKENATDLDVNLKTKSKKNTTIKKGGKKGGILEKNQKYKKVHPFKGDTGGCMVQDKIQDFSLFTDHNLENQNIPLYNIEAAAGLVPLFNDTTSQKPVDFITIPNLPKCDGAIHVTGDSMYPLLKSGDMVLYKQINDIASNIFWGEMYLISIDMDGEEYVTVKYIQKSEKKDFIKLASHNQHHSDKDIHISKVRALAFVKASIRINSMK